SSAAAVDLKEGNKTTEAVTATTTSTTTNENQGGESKPEGGKGEETSGSDETPNGSESTNASSGNGAGGGGTSTGGNSTDESNNESKTEPEETKSEPEPEKEKTTDSGLNEEESQAKIDELQAESDAAHEKENSTANRLLGAAGIGATGIGAMQMMSGMAEQNADEDAENQMKAYLATFRCNYGGLSHKGGEMAIELPGAGDLLPLYTEYVNLANDLKIRKAALDMRPGMEAEAILDGATSGLYDDVHTGKTTGMYTSLARALSDPNGEDAKKWQEQKDAAAKKKKTGMITAAVGAAGSLVGNLIINRDKKDKDKKTESDEQIAKKYQPVSDLATNVSNLPTPIITCPEGTTGTYPKCEKNTYVSNDLTYNPTSNKLEPQSKVDTEKVVAAEKQREQDKLENNKEGSVTVNLPSVNMFEINSANLTGASMRNLNDFITKLEATGAENCLKLARMCCCSYAALGNNI
ncbi:MAG: hypothetical protein IJC46_04495, partial [Clostridia bacterium]|nr:hypothetical protein [Clostridia bacterium]